jgi:AraC-like DNA-binding protein
MTFGRWRQQFQIMVAVRELASGVSVESVSESLGYGSKSAFTLIFKADVMTSSGVARQAALRNAMRQAEQETDSLWFVHLFRARH